MLLLKGPREIQTDADTVVLFRPLLVVRIQKKYQKLASICISRFFLGNNMAAEKLCQTPIL